uniref:RING-type E3 ubiquitin transferase n=1 Tax=Photinus pyralis TaxID=7054 RepID=A0A1Y1MGB8_PHOPY
MEREGIEDTTEGPAIEDIEMKPVPSNPTDHQTNGATEESKNEHDFNRSCLDDDEGRLCPICLESWTNAGDHRVCSLKCGHVFGQACIERWFSTQKTKSCPSCKAKSSSRHIWFIYSKTLVPMNSDCIDEAKQDIVCANAKRDKVKIELQNGLLREEALKKEILELAGDVQFLNKEVQLRQHVSVPSASNTSCRLHLDRSLTLCEEPSCRVLDYFYKKHIIVASVKSSNALFPGFGARQLDMATCRLTTYIPLHSAAIRDFKFNTDNPYLLSVSLDKTAKLVGVSPLAAPVCIYTSNSPLWSCCWDSSNSNYVYIGGQEGSVMKIDIRQPGKPVSTMEVPGDRSPVVSVASIPPNSNRAMPDGGIISCKLNSLWAFQTNGEEYTRHQLPLEGPFVSMVYQHFTNEFLISSRPNSQHPYSRHYLWCLDSVADDVTCNITHTIRGSTVQSYLSRSCFITHNYNSFIAAYQESDRSMCLWNAKTGNKVCSAAARDPILDICGININNESFVVSLSQRKVMFHKCL